jgi:hypothetical protein
VTQIPDSRVRARAGIWMTLLEPLQVPETAELAQFLPPRLVDLARAHRRRRPVRRHATHQPPDLAGVSETRVQAGLARRSDCSMRKMGRCSTCSKASRGQPIELPRRKTWQPDRDLLASRFETFSGAA